MLKERCTTLNSVPRNRNRVGRRVLVVCGFLLVVAPGLLGSQSNSSEAPATPHPGSPAAPPKTDARPIDDFAGLAFTEDQKAKMAQIRQNAKLRREAVVKNEKLTERQKEVTLEGLQRIENSEIFRVLTPDQQAEVHRRIMARHAAEQQVQQQSKPAARAPQ